MPLALCVTMTPDGAPRDQIVVQHAGEVLILRVYRRAADGLNRVHIAFAGPRSFSIDHERIEDLTGTDCIEETAHTAAAAADDAAPA
jgi:hypothetical protein